MLLKDDNPTALNKKQKHSSSAFIITGKNNHNPVKKTTNRAKTYSVNVLKKIIKSQNHSSMTMIQKHDDKPLPMTNINIQKPIKIQEDNTIYHKIYNVNTIVDTGEQTIPNKTIYMTYKKNIPNFVFGRWKNLNPDYTIEFNVDHDCISFLEKHFNNYIADLFKRIPKGMYKADLWRLCKLYINGGIYADVDLVPYLNINGLDKNISFYSCLAVNKKSIFQAFMVNFSKPRNPLLLSFLISYLMNNPYRYNDGPTYDMYNCIKNNLNGQSVLSDKKYELNEIKIPVTIGSSETSTKTINLYYFPNDNDYNYTIKLNSNEYKDEFKFEIINNSLIVTRIDQNCGWGHDHSCNICIVSNESIFLFKENESANCYVTHNNNKILDSRDSSYSRNKGW
jgi:hypothetical protein